MSCSWEDAHMLLQHAGDSIRKGECEGAVVVASNINRFPETSALLRQMGLHSADGITRSFDNDGSLCL